MTIITLDDSLLNEVIAVSHQKNVQEAGLKILAEYLLQHKKESSFFEKLRVVDDFSDEDVDALFLRNKDIA
jgi:hypothetical protein